MTNEEKIKIFEEYLEMIEIEPIKEFTKYCIVNFPDYFFTLKASTGDKYHGKDEALTDHILGMCWLGVRVKKQFEKIWTNKQGDCLFLAIIAHDAWRCTNPDGSLEIFTQEKINKHNLPQELLGNFKTTRSHPETAALNLLRLGTEFNKKRAKESKNQMAIKDLNNIIGAVRSHSGPWTLNKRDVKFSLEYPFSNISIQLHNLDYQQTINAEYWTRYKPEQDKLKKGKL